MRDQLAEVIATDELAGRLVRRVRPPEVDESGEVRRGAGGVATPIHVKKNLFKAG